MNPGGVPPGGAPVASTSRRLKSRPGGLASILRRYRGVVATGAAILVLAGALAAAVVWYPLAGIAAAAALLAVLVARCAPRPVERLFLRLLVVVLVGYALLGRTFAGIGVPPVYVGEVVLGLGLLTVVGAGWHFRLVRTPTLYLLIAFMCWGAARTVPYLGTYRLNAVRDAVLWGYGMFALLLAPLLLRRDLVGRIPQLYARVVPWIVVVGPAWVVLWLVSGRGGIPGTFIAGAKPGDAAPHLAGAAAFLLAGLAARRAGGRTLASTLGEWGVWLALLVGIVAVGSISRGGLLAIIAAILTVAMMQPFKAGKRLVLAGATALLVATVWLGWQYAYVVPDRDRAINPEQIAKNLMSIGGGSTNNLEGTRQWRLLWWNKILDYTVHGEYFWTGKGFGVNLTYDDGIERDPENPSRNPHNGHLTILARAGVPGLALWAALQLWFAFSIGRGWLRARQAGQHVLASLFVWVLAYWIAVLVDASFDPYLEGPQGGIWFWCVFAYGMALTMTQARRAPALQPLVAAASRDPAPALTASGHS